MFSFLKKDPIQALENKRKKLLEEAMHVQRSGDLKLYAVKMEAIDKLGEFETKILQYEFKDGVNKYLAGANAKVVAKSPVIEVVQALPPGQAAAEKW
jgi:hypothetical protein